MTQPRLDDVTFCVKTIHRPHACHRIVESILYHYPKARIDILDDGQPKFRYSTHYPGDVKLLNALHELDTFDVGASAGRNELVARAETPYVFIVDDDMVLTRKTRINMVLRRLHDNRDTVDLIGWRHPDAGRPRLMDPIHKGRLWVRHGTHRWNGHLGHCDMVDQIILAPKEIMEYHPWDPDLKIYEHWYYFWTAKLAGLNVAVSSDTSVLHKGGQPLGGYGRLRHRRQFFNLALKKAGFRDLKMGGSVSPDKIKPLGAYRGKEKEEDISRRRKETDNPNADQ